MTSSAIVLLILFILAAAALLIYCYLRRSLRPLPLRLSAAEVPLQSTHSSFRRVSPAPPPSDGGLHLLPLFRFSDVTRPGSVTVTGDCAICLSEFEPDHHLRLLPLCLHAFHVDCIDTWLAGESRICPVCRAEVFRSDSDLLRAVGGSFRVAIGSVSRGPRLASSSSRVHSIRGGELEYVVEEERELQLRDAVLPVHEDEIMDVVIDGQPPISEYESSYGVVFMGSSRRWMDLSEGIEWISQFLKM